MGVLKNLLPGALRGTYQTVFKKALNVWFARAIEYGLITNDRDSVTLVHKAHR